jgi:hypothetical protein
MMPSSNTRSWREMPGFFGTEITWPYPLQICVPPQPVEDKAHRDAEQTACRTFMWLEIQQLMNDELLEFEERRAGRRPSDQPLGAPMVAFIKKIAKMANE